MSLFDDAMLDEDTHLRETDERLLSLGRRMSQAMADLGLTAQITTDARSGRLSLHTYLGTNVDSDRFVRTLEDVARG
jgi:hypothetical protein